MTAGETARKAFGWYLIIWAVTWLPFFLFLAAWAGSITSALSSVVSVAGDGDIGAALFLAAGLPVLATPFWVWSRHDARRKPVEKPE